MLFLISLGVAVCFVLLLGETLRKHPAPFYIAAAALSIGSVFLTELRNSNLPSFVTEYIIPQLTKGTLATAFWAIVMWTGALPNIPAVMKRLMPVRGQLSIFAAILTLGHAAGFALSFFPRWLKKGEYANFTVCILLMLIMIPLTVLSVRRIRKKIKPKTWKAIQRFAYLFYALIPFHVILVNYKRLKGGRTEVFFSLMAYLAVFLGYAVFRLRKWYVSSRKPQKQLALNLAAAASFACLFALAFFAAKPEPRQHTRQRVTAEVSDRTAPIHSETTVAASTTAVKSQANEAHTDQTEAETTVTDGTDVSSETEVTTTVSDSPDPPEEQEDSEQEPQQAEAIPEPQTPDPVVPEKQEPVRVYRNGTFTGTAFGYDGDITVYVTIQDDIITALDGETWESDDSYYFDAKKVVFPAILNTQSTHVDACSGATCSSDAIMKAVQAALESAKV